MRSSILLTPLRTLVKLISYHKGPELCVRELYKPLNVLPKHSLSTSSLQLKPRDQLVSNPFDVTGKDLYTSGCKYLVNIDKNNTHADVLDEQVNKLSGVLYQLLLKNDCHYLLKFFNEMIHHQLLNESAYTIIMRYYSNQKDLTRVVELFKELQSNPHIPLHSRSYIPLITVGIRVGEFDFANKYFDDMLMELQMKYNDNVVQDILTVCTNSLTNDNQIEVYYIVNKVFTLLERYGASNLKELTVNAIVAWFENDKFNKWYIKATSIGKKNGMCQYCKRRLQPADIPSDRLIRLKRNLSTLVKAAILRKETLRLTDVRPMKTNINIKNKITSKSKYFEFYDAVVMEKREETGNTRQESYEEAIVDDQNSVLFEKLNKLKMFLETNGPYDIVIDALNVGYFTHGFNPILVRDLVQHFADEKKKILILCAGPMKEDLLTAGEVPLANRHLQQLMLFLTKHANLFFIGSSVVDDYYILYTLIHYNFDIELVSRDLFRDHLFHLDSENTADFQRWQRAHQYILKTVTVDGRPIFRARMNFNHTMQGHVAGWHLPLNDRAWLCIEKIEDKA